MTRDAYQRQLAELGSMVVELGRAVSRQLQSGVWALARNDCELAEWVKTGDDPIDELTARVEAHCVHLIALQQPVAVDMRRITASFKIVTDLERIGDLAVHLAEHCCASGPLDLVQPERIAVIGTTAVSMVEDVIRAYQSDDEALAWEVIQRDSEVDEGTGAIVHAVLRGLCDWRASGDEAPEQIVAQAQSLLMSMRELERAADHAENVAERVLYILTAQVVKS